MLILFLHFRLGQDHSFKIRADMQPKGKLYNLNMTLIVIGKMYYSIDKDTNLYCENI